MCVDIDKAGSDQAVFGVDFLAALSGDIPDRGYASIDDGDVGLGRFAAFSIGDGTAPDNQIVGGTHGIISSNSCRQNGLASNSACQGKSAAAAA
jgi:hypothetical protein